MTRVATAIPPSFLESAFMAAVTRLRAGRARRAQRIALRALMEFDPERLDDLGITAQDVLEALRATPPAPGYLEGRRASRAGAWAPATTGAA